MVGFTYSVLIAKKMITIKDVEGYHERWWMCLWPSWRWWFYEYVKVKMKVLVAQSCAALWSPVDCNLPGSSVPGILQAGILERVAVSFSRGSSPPRDQTWVSCSAGRCLPSEPPGSPHEHILIPKLIELYVLTMYHLFTCQLYLKKVV